MKRCSVVKNLTVCKGCPDDYKKLAKFHYRDVNPGPHAAIYTFDKPVAVVVYTMPTCGSSLRNKAMMGLLDGLDRSDRLAAINANIRCISRVIVDPRYRSLGLAWRLVQQTMPLMNVPVIESVAVMGLVNPFFERAGMKSLTAPPSMQTAQLLEAFSAVGLEGDDLLDGTLVNKHLESLTASMRDFIEEQISNFLSCHGKRRYSRPGLERIAFVLARLTHRPIYYYWLNEECNFKFQTEHIT